MSVYYLYATIIIIYIAAQHTRTTKRPRFIDQEAEENFFRVQTARSRTNEQKRYTSEAPYPPSVGGGHIFSGSGGVGLTSCGSHFTLGVLF